MQSELLTVIGQLVYYNRLEKKDGSGQLYGEVVIKVSKKLAEDEYSMVYNTYYGIVSGDVLPQLQNDLAKAKGNEVEAVFEVNGRVDKRESGNRYNRIGLYLKAIKVTRELARAKK